MKRYVEIDGKLKIDWDAVEMSPANLEAAKKYKDFLTLKSDLYLKDHPSLVHEMGDYCVRIIVSSNI